VEPSVHHEISLHPDAADRDDGPVASSVERVTPSSTRYPEIAVLDEVGIGLFILDPSGELAATNASAEALLQRRATLLGEIRERARERGSSGRQGQVMVDGELGRHRLIGYRLVRSPQLGTIVTLRDITELERARVERATLERLSEVGRACAMVAHEIGNPLAALKATLQSIEREAAAAGLGDTIGAVFREVDRLDNILGQLLGFVRHRSPRRSWSTLGLIVERARAAAGARLEGIALYGPWGALPELHCDADQIEQVLLNLFLNAADAMPGGGEIVVSGYVAGADLVVVVEDSGPGVPPELREKVFQSFYTTKSAGVGLGLSVCFRIMSDHGGSIAIEDREGGPGAAVRLTLPLARSG
jgi:signal transduction histidine kinase